MSSRDIGTRVMRANLKFALAVRRLAREGRKQEGRPVSSTEVTALLATIVPATWPELRAIVGASRTTTEEKAS